jgi:hypothetical protein
MDLEVLNLVQHIYSSEDAAGAVLLKIGYEPEWIRGFISADIFWPKTLKYLDLRVAGGTVRLLEQAAVDYPASDARRLLTEIKATDPVPERSAGLEPGVVVIEESASIWSDDMVLSGPLEIKKRQAPEGEPPPPPESFAEAANARDGGCPTLTLEGADLPEEFLAAAGELLGPSVRMLYVTDGQSAVRIPDPGDDDEWMRREIQKRMREIQREDEPKCRVAYRKYPFEPYVYVNLRVYGPDMTGYLGELIPATATPLDVAAVFLAKTSGALPDGRDAIVRAVIDLDEPSKRLDPYATLHECGVREGAKLRIGTQAVAGNLDPVLRMEAQLRAVSQVQAYAEANPGRFTVEAYDDDELPGCVTVSFTAKGLALPDLTDGANGLAPTIIFLHWVSLYFRPMFPLVAPLIVWETPIFHPNIRWPGIEGSPAGTLLLFHPLLANYRPERDLAHILKLLAEVARYRWYDLAAGEASPNPVAARWAGTDSGQKMIRDIGGRDVDDPHREGDSGHRQSSLLWLRPNGTGARPDGP